MAMAREGRTSPGHHHEEKHTVLKRDDIIYAENLDELMEMFRASLKLLEELGFQEIEEHYSEHWETLPFKNGVEAYKWKDPYTAIELHLAARVKEPRSDRKTKEDTYKVKILVTASVVRMRYPHWEWFEESTMFKRSWFYRAFKRLLDSFIFRKELEKYEEEAEELAIEFTSHLREVEGSLPAIGRSKREWYNPERGSEL